MGYSIKNNTKVAIMPEVTEGTFVGPTGGTDFIQVKSDGFSLEQTKEVLERSLLGGGLGMATPRTGMWEVTGEIGVEFKANGTEGAAPEYGLLMESAFGDVRSAVTKMSSDADGGTYSATKICFANADKNNFAVGDVVMTKRAGAYHISPISAVDNTDNQVSITLLVADPAGAYVDGIAVSAVTTYLPADEDHPSFSVSKYIEDAILEQAAGCKCTGVSLEGFTTGQIASWNFSFDGLNTDRSVSANALTPSFDTALPPIILEACVYQAGVKVAVNEVALSVENELGLITSTCASSGKISSRVTGRKITGSFNPYKSNADVANWTLFKNNTEFSLFLVAKVPTSTAGQYKDVIGIYMPKCIITEMGEADQDGVLQDELSFSATAGSDQSTPEIYVSFI